MVLFLVFLVPIAVLYDEDEPGFVGALAISAILLATWLGLFRMNTYVDRRALTVSFGFFPMYRMRIPIGEIREVESVVYRPLRDYGGWGIRGIPVAALNARGNRGVRLVRSDGRKLLIGSQKPEELVESLLEAGQGHISVKR